MPNTRLHNVRQCRLSHRGIHFVLLLTGISVILACVPISAQSVPHSSHVVLVIEENRSYTTVTNVNGGVNYMPWLVGEGTTYGHATNYISNTTGSLMDYLWLSSGSCHSSANCTLPPGTNNFGCTGDGCFTSTGAVWPITDNNIFKQLDSLGISWKIYSESMPSPGFMSLSSSDGLYVARHNPARWYDTIISGGTAEQDKMVPFSQFSTDLANNALPSYSIIVPNLQDDAHDNTPQMADNWLKNNVAPVLNQSYFGTNGDGLLIITFDNGDNDDAGQVYTAVIGPNVIKGSAPNSEYQHQSTLATICAALGVTACPGAGGTATPMSAFFQSSGSAGVTISNPTNVPQITSPVPLNATATSNGLPITTMNVYVNSSLLTSFSGDGHSPTLTAHWAFPETPGTYQINANAWDSAGTLYQSPVVTFTVASTGMNIIAPGNSSQVTGLSPFDAKVTSNGANITAMDAYLDFNPTPIATFNGTSTTTLIGTSTYSFTTGPHVLIVNAWDTTGKIYQSAVAFTVSNTGVVIGAPGTNSQVTNGTPFQATATSNGPVITTMSVYLDYGSSTFASYNGNNTNTLGEDANYSIAAGSHILIVNAWDSSGQIYQSAVPFTVSATGVVVNSPAANSTVNSPVNFSATATSNGQPISTMNVYLDFNPTALGSYSGNGTSTFTENTSYTIASGSHILIVNAWDSKGQIYQTAVSFTVQ